MQPTSDIGRKRQSEIYINGVSGKKPRVPVAFARLEKRARRKMSRPAFAYMAGGAGHENTIDANRQAFERWQIVPRILRDVSQRDTTATLFGEMLPTPFLLAPIGVLELAHKEADLAVAKAAAAEGIPMIFSNQASKPMEACAAVMGNSPRWFQLYWSKSDELVMSFVRRAEACGCRAIVVTLDTTLLGWRQRDLDLAYLPFLRGKGIAQYTSDPVFQASLQQPAAADSGATRRRITPATIRTLIELKRSGNSLGAVRQFINTYSRPSLTWENLAYLRQQTQLPILLKGILHVDDARKALDYGMNGIIVSNHGGRQVDGAIASLDALPPIVEAVGDKLTVLLDSGIRGGADVFKALALGAKAVCLGRPYAYGLGIAGSAGVQEVIINFKADFDLTMGLAGCRSLADITPQTLRRRD